jgi:hypothetical protein
MAARIVLALGRAWGVSRGWCTARGRALVARFLPWRPVVAADVQGKRGRRLRTEIARVTRTHLRALGVTPPQHLLVVVQRTVVEEGRPLAALLQVFEDGEGRRRHVLFVALSADERQVSNEEVVATLRQQLQRVVGDELGTLRVSVPLEPARTRAGLGRPDPAGRGAAAVRPRAPPPEAFRGLRRRRLRRRGRKVGSDR